MTTPLVLNKKVCLIGRFGVGKTSLVERFVHNRFGEEYLTTVGVRVSQKLLPPLEKAPGQVVQYRLLIWDIAGVEKFDRMTATYLKGAAGVLAVADLTRPATVDILELLLQEFRERNADGGIVLLGNKNDLTYSESVTEILHAIGKQFQVPVLLTSAKTGNNVEQAFLKLAEQL